MENVLASALVGTGHQAPAAAEAEPWDAALSKDSPERALLLRAGAWAVYRQAGKQPLAAPGAPAPAPAEGRPACSERAELLLRELEGGQGRQPVFLEALRVLAARGLRLPHGLLPAALDQRDEAIREALVPVLGERGPWLAAFNPAWAWARRLELPENVDLEAASRLWQEGTPVERLVAFRTARGAEPAIARAWLAEGFSKEKAAQRAGWVQVLGETLGPEDEAFLERCLDDRSGEVRAQAARLLARLPGSALSGRMRERAAALVGAKKGIFRTTLTIARPEALPADWARDGIAALPGESERDGWLRSLVSFLPPGYWQERLGGTPEQVVAAIGKADDGGPLLLGLADAVAAFEAPGWAGTLWAALSRPDRATDRWNVQALAPLGEMLRRVPRGELEGLILERLAAGEIRGAFHLLGAYRGPWSERLVAAYLGQLKRHVKAVGELERYEYWSDPWLPTLAQAGLGMPPEALDRLDAAIPPVPDGVSAPHRPLLDSLDRVRELLALRQRLDKEITA